MLRQYVGLACKIIRIPRQYGAPSNHSRCFSTQSNGPSTPLVYPEPPSAHHSSLESFLAYAERWQLDRASTVYVGTLYEYSIAKSLERYGFHLKRVGGASDYGIDLLGEWKPPSTSTTLRVIIQCKGGAQRVGPNLIRELEGAFVGAPAGWRGQGVLGLMVAQRPATKGVRDSLGRSKWPMGYLFCEGEGEVKQMIWNRRAEEEGLEGFGVTTRHVEAKKEPELALMKQGKLLPLVTTNG